MFLYPYPVYPRKQREVFFKRAYNLMMVLNFAAWIIVMMDFVSRVDNTFVDYWKADSRFEMYKPLANILSGCNYTADVSFFNYPGQTTITLESAPYHFLQVTAAIRAIFIIHAISIGFDFLPKLMFSLNIRHLRIRGLHIPLNLVFLMIMLCISCCLIGLVVETNGQRAFLNNFIEKCTDEYKAANSAAFNSAEQDTKTVFGTAVQALMIMTCCNLGLYFIAFIFLVIHSSKDATARALQLEFPWEKGVFCKPNKPVLVSYCRERKEWEAQVMNIDVKGELQRKSLAAALEYNPTAVPDIAPDVITNPTLPPPQQTFRPMNANQLHMFPTQQMGPPPGVPPQQQQQPPQQPGNVYQGGQPGGAATIPPEELNLQPDTEGDAGASGVDQPDGLESGVQQNSSRPKKKVKRKKQKSDEQGGGATTGDEDIDGGERQHKKKKKRKHSTSELVGEMSDQPDQAFPEA